ncbi:MAG: TonB-dependent receptor [Cyclobacteriaceae bacterium]|nr:TonB-dependent receptor [Cyclobacteriaceae bacterium HetDA_MAG_MS6]
MKFTDLKAQYGSIFACKYWNSKTQMIRSVGLVLGLISISFLSFSQVITIKNSQTNRPISDVFIFPLSGKITAFTNLDGKADLTGFPEDEKIYFQHPGFEQIKLDYSDIVASRFKIELTEKIVSFNEVVIAASKWQQDRDELPNDVLSIRKKDISFANPQTSADLLANSGQVYVQKSQLGGGSPTLRGFAANAVLLAVDGIRLNNAIYRSGNLQNIINIDPNTVASSEVVFGPGSVIYGSDALGGVMDFQTIKPSFASEGLTKFEGNAFFRYGSAANERTSHLDIALSKEKWSYFGSISYTDFDDLKAGANRSEAFDGFFERKFYVKRIDGQDRLVENDDVNVQKFSGYDLINTTHKLRLKLSSNAQLTYAFYHSATSDIPRYDRLTLPIGDTDSLAFAEWYYGPQAWSMHALKYESFKKNFLFDRSQASFSFQQYEESRNDRSFGSSSLRTRTEQVDLFTFNADFEKSVSKGSLFYGIDGFHNDVTSSGFRKNLSSGEITQTSTRYPDGGSQYFSLAAYTNYQQNVNKKWIWNLGARYSGVWLKAKTEDNSARTLFFDKINLFNQALNGSAGLVYNPRKSTKWSLLLSSGFRAPNVDDVGKLFEIDNDIIVVPNEDLKPEFSYNQEISLEQKLVSNIQLDVVIYHSILNNAIVRGPFEIDGQSTLIVDGEPKEIRAQINADRARLYGASISLKSKVNEFLGFTSTLNINEGQDLSNDEPIRHATPLFGQTSLAFQKKRFKSSLIFDYHFRRGRKHIPSSEIDDKPHLFTTSGSPGWYTANFRMSYTLPKYLSFEAGIENVFDKHYRTYSSGISAPGRNIYLNLRLTI